MVADNDGIAIDPDGYANRSHHGIVFREVGERSSVGKIVDSNKFDLGMIQRGAHDLPANAAEAVNTYFHGHSTGVLSFRG